jgi:hypothetical protein
MLENRNLIDTRHQNGKTIRVWFKVIESGKAVWIYVGTNSYNLNSKPLVESLMQWHAKILEMVGYVNINLSPKKPSKRTYFFAKDHEGAEVCGLMTKFQR